MMSKSLSACCNSTGRNKDYLFAFALRSLSTRISFSIFVKFSSPVSGWVREEEPIFITILFLSFKLLRFVASIGIFCQLPSA